MLKLHLKRHTLLTAAISASIIASFVRCWADTSVSESPSSNPFNDSLTGTGNVSLTITDSGTGTDVSGETTATATTSNTATATTIVHGGSSSTSRGGSATGSAEASTGSGSASATVKAYGGNGSPGADVWLTNAVGGSTTGALTLDQESNGGSGINDDVTNGGTASSVLVGNYTNPSSVQIGLLSQGGFAADNEILDDPSIIGGIGGVATAYGEITASHDVTLSLTASAGDSTAVEEFYYGVTGQAGADAIASASVISTGRGNVTITGNITGGRGGDGVRGNAGDGGVAVPEIFSGSSTGSGGNGLVSATLYVNGGAGGDAHQNSDVSMAPITAGTGASENIYNSVAGSTGTSGTLSLTQNVTGGAAGSADGNYASAGSGGSATSSLIIPSTTSAASVTIITSAIGQDGGNSSAVSPTIRAGNGGDATAISYAYNVHGSASSTASATGGADGVAYGNASFNGSDGSSLAIAYATASGNTSMTGGTAYAYATAGNGNGNGNAIASATSTYTTAFSDAYAQHGFGYSLAQGSGGTAASVFVPTLASSSIVEVTSSSPQSSFPAIGGSTTTGNISVSGSVQEFLGLWTVSSISTSSSTLVSTETLNTDFNTSDLLNSPQSLILGSLNSSFGTISELDFEAIIGGYAVIDDTFSSGSAAAAYFSSPILLASGNFTGDLSVSLTIEVKTTSSGQGFTGSFGFSNSSTGQLFDIWNQSAGGTWNSSGHWGTLPNAAGAFAELPNNSTSTQTITLDTAITVGGISFDSPYNYTIASGSSGNLTFDNSGDSTFLLSSAGNHTISANITLTSDLQINTTSSSQINLTGTLSVPSGTTVTKLGSGNLALTGTVWNQSGSNFINQQGNTTSTGNLTLNNLTNYASFTQSSGNITTTNTIVAAGGTFTQSGGNHTISNLTISGCYSQIGGYVSAASTVISSGGTFHTGNTGYGMNSSLGYVSGNGTLNDDTYGNITVSSINMPNGTVRVQQSTLTFTSTSATRQTSGVLIEIGNLTVNDDDGGQVDLNNHDLLIHGGTTSDEMGTLLQYGNITSSDATANGMALGYISGSDIGASISLYGSAYSSTFDGIPVDISPESTDVLVKYTYPGDINLDGKVDGTDVSIFNDNGEGLTGWAGGDFNGDGVIDGADWDILAAHLGDGTGGDMGSPLLAFPSNAPEPASLLITACGIFSLLIRRRRPHLKPPISV